MSASAPSGSVYLGCWQRHVPFHRNVADISKALAELARVLRPGARLAVLDFNNSQQPLVDGLQVCRALLLPACCCQPVAAIMCKSVWTLSVAIRFKICRPIPL